jgi:hypothetical protein
LLPTFPLVALLFARAYGDLRQWNATVARPLLAVLLVTSAIYAGIGLAGFASISRDEAESWLTENGDPRYRRGVPREHLGHRGSTRNDYDSRYDPGQRD